MLTNHKLNCSAVVVMLVAVFAFPVIILGTTTGLPSGWSGGMISENYFVSASTIDQNGKIHVTMVNVSDSQDNKYRLYYTNNVDGSWAVPSFIQNATNLNSWIGIGPDGRCHVVYTVPNSNYNHDLVYSVRDNGAWTSSVLLSELLSNTFLPSFSVIMDDDSKLHIAYTTNYNDPELHYLTNEGGSWTNESVFNLLNVDTITFGNPVIGLDSLGNVNIVFSESTLNMVMVNGTYSHSTYSINLTLAKQSGASWQIEDLDTSGNLSIMSVKDMAIDKNDHIHIAYTKSLGGIYTTEEIFNQSGWVEYLTNSGGTWTNYSVTNLSAVISSIYGFDIAVDANDDPYIMLVNGTQYYNETSGSWSFSFTESKIMELSGSSWETDAEFPKSLLSDMTISASNKMLITYSQYDVLESENGNFTTMYAVRDLGSVETVPSKPTNFNLDAGDQKVDLSWSDPISDGGLALTGFKIFRGTSAESMSELATVGSATHTYTDTSVTNGNTYYYKVAAVNSLGTGAFTATLSATPSLPTVPGPPTEFSISAGDAHVALTWSAPLDDGGSDITKYRVYKGYNATEFPSWADLLADSFDYDDFSVTNGETYYYKVVAFNSVGEGQNTSILSATPTATVIDEEPGPVTDLETEVEDGEVVVTWGDPTTGGEPDYFLIYRSTTNIRPSAPLTNVTATTHVYVDDSVVEGTTYYYWVVPCNSIGEGSPSTTGAVEVATSDDGGSDDNTMLYVVALVAVIAIIGVAGYALMRRKKS